MIAIITAIGIIIADLLIQLENIPYKVVTINIHVDSVEYQIDVPARL